MIIMTCLKLMLPSYVLAMSGWIICPLCHHPDPHPPREKDQDNTFVSIPWILEQDFLTPSWQLRGVMPQVRLRPEWGQGLCHLSLKEEIPRWRSALQTKISSKYNRNNGDNSNNSKSNKGEQEKQPQQKPTKMMTESRAGEKETYHLLISRSY